MPSICHNPEGRRAAWFLVGPTAVGKSAVAQHLAEQTGAAILSADAMLVYRGMDIGTAKPTPAERGCVPYLGLDVVDPDQSFSAGAWLAAVREQMAGLAAPLPHAAACATDGPVAAGDWIVAGGTGLYLRALTDGLEAGAADPERRRFWQERLARDGLSALCGELRRRAPEAAVREVDLGNPRRVIRALELLEARGALPTGWRAAPVMRAVGLHWPRPVLHARIASRVEHMFAAGLIDEVRALRARFPSWEACRTEAVGVASPRAPLVCTAGQAIGYAEVSALLDGRLTLAQAKEQIATRTRQLAKRQETWLRHQAAVTWLESGPDEPVAVLAARVLTAWREHGPTPIRGC